MLLKQGGLLIFASDKEEGKNGCSTYPIGFDLTPKHLHLGSTQDHSRVIDTHQQPPFAFNCSIKTLTFSFLVL
ncbi:MAG: hypothetical protein ABIK67_05255 [candidate division WOR-3 bacterium]